MICRISSLPSRVGPGAPELPLCTRCPLVASCPRAGALRLGPGGPGDTVCLFESDWDRVDAARMRADAAGIADRVSVHHVAALDWVGAAR